MVDLKKSSCSSCKPSPPKRLAPTSTKLYRCEIQDADETGGHHLVGNALSGVGGHRQNR